MTLVLNRITLDTLPPFKLREADELECLAGGMSPDLAVRRSISVSDNAFAHYWDCELLCLWGYTLEDKVARIARMWLLSTPAVEDHKIAFGRASKKLLKMILQDCRVINILVHNQHSVAIRWLEWLGFTRAEALNEHFTSMRYV